MIINRLDKTTGLTVVAACVLLASLAIAQDNVTTWHVYQTPTPPPDSLEDTVVASHAVVRATIKDVKVVMAPARPGEPYPAVRTLYTASPSEAFKPHGTFADGRPITIAVEGGEYREGTRVWRAINESLPTLVPGKEYILFLYWNEKDLAFRPYFGPEMMVEVRGGLNKRLGASVAASKLQLPASTSELETELRAIASRVARK